MSHRVGIYVRLSKEDKRSGESVSIENQKLMLIKHVRDNGWTLYDVYCDDGFSGTNQNRPSFRRMIADVEQGTINTILIKDLSRLGRNYLEVGLLAEVFLPEHNCKLISLSETLDDMMVFRNWFNEQHSKSTSIKVRASRRICAENGKYMGAYAPYGYIKSPDNRHKLIPDISVAPVIRRIFEERAAGTGFRVIAERLTADEILPPREYYYRSRGRDNPHGVCNEWSETTVKDIIRNEVYIGSLVQGKSGTVSYKNPRQINKPQDEWIRTVNAHEPLIERELWEHVRSLTRKRLRIRRRNDGKVYLFSGLLYCADCGAKLRGHNGGYICGTYAKNGRSTCSAHNINDELLTAAVPLHIIITRESLFRHVSKMIVGSSGDVEVVLL